MDHDYCKPISTSRVSDEDSNSAHCQIHGNKLAQEMVRNVYQYFVEQHDDEAASTPKYYDLLMDILRGDEGLVEEVEIETLSCNINQFSAKVIKLLENITLTKQMKISDLEAIFWSLQSSLDVSKDNPVQHLGEYIFPDEPSNSNDVHSSMLRDTADLLESEEVKYLVVHYINTGFVLLGDQMSEFFAENRTKISEITPNSGSEKFRNPFMNKKHLAKLIPILNGLLSKQSLPQNLMQFLISNEKLQTLCANVYESLLS